MNIKRGMDRIAFVISALVAVVATIYGYDLIYKQAKTNPEHIKWEKNIREEWVKRQEPTDKPEVLSKYIHLFPDAFPSFMKEMPPEPARYVYPSGLKPLGLLLVFPTASFVITLFVIMGSTRLSLWISKGFKDEGK